MGTTCSLTKPTSSLARAFPDPPEDFHSDGPVERLTLSGGCFWCTEAVYRQFDGVLEVTSGYTGDTAETANYTAVSSGKTNHAEAVQIEFDPRRVSLGQLLKVFFSVAHNPTHLDRQADDVGRHYRSTVFYANEDQRRVADAYIRELDRAHYYDAPIATTLEPLTGFYPAEAEFQDYVSRNPTDPYVEAKSQPKVDKARKWFSGEPQSSQ
jgi:peptide-methionine (S)-S-oxide reductase